LCWSWRRHSFIPPGLVLCLGIAKALDIDPVFVMRQAGILPPQSEQAQLRAQLVYYFDQLDKTRQEDLVAIAKALHETRKKRASYLRNAQIPPE